LTRTSPLSDAIDFAENPEPRCPCVLLLDTSGSMQGERIRALNEGLKTLHGDLVKDSLASRRVELAVLTFSSGVHEVTGFTTAHHFTPPTLAASGQTHMAAGIIRALDLVENRKQVYRENGICYYRPWIFLITDGKPEGEAADYVRLAAHRVRDAEDAKRVAFFAVGVEDADITELSKISVRTPLKLRGLDFTSMFLWLSSSMQSVSHSDTNDVMVPLAPAGWAHV
jgi:uncharacterized protein YegL